MYKITLLGDSIRQIGYGTKVPELLGEGFEVYQPKENCRFSKHTVRGVMCEWANDIKGSDIVHWNNGLWDVIDYGYGVFTPEQEYISNMLKIAEMLQDKAGKVIFATITPVTENYKLSNVDRIRRYNEIIVPDLEKQGVIINDLFTPVWNNIDTYIRKDDNIHLTEAGIDACARQVCDIIKKNL